jgi:hypothetical protein
MRQRMYCHECDRYFSVDMNMKADGNHVFKCAYCGHEHCRVVKDGEITSDRWDQRNGSMGLVYQVRSYTDTYYSSASATTDSFTYAAWSSTTGTSTYAT